MAVIGRLAKGFAEAVQDLVRRGFPQGTAEKIVSGELPMDEASRMARASEQGFTEDLYHSTYNAFDEIDQDRVDLGLHMGGIDQATNRLKHTAERRGGHRYGDSGYADGANIMPLMVRKGGVVEAPDVGMWNDSERVIAETPMWGNGDLYDEALEAKNSFETVPDWHESPENRELLDEIRDGISGDTVRYKNEVESSYTYRPEVQQRRTEIGDEILNIENRYPRPDLPETLPDDPAELQALLDDYQGWKLDDVMSDLDKARIQELKDESMRITSGDGAYVDQNSYIALDPANVRSKFAAFDPDNIGKPNLLGALTGAAPAIGVGALAAGGSQDADAGPLGAGARRVIDDRFLNALGGSNPRVGLRDTVAEMQTGITPRELNIGGEYNLWDFEGSPYILTQSDRSAAGGVLDSVHGTQISPVDLRGGRDFMFDPKSEGQVWASDPSVVNSLYKRAGSLSDQYGSDTLLLPYSMAPTGIDFATMPLDTMVGYAREKMGRANIRALDKQIKEVIPSWGGIDNPDAVKIFRDVKGPKRKQIADIIDKNFRDVRGGMSISEARAATSDASQYMTPEGQITNIGRIDNSAPIVTDSGHPTYVGGLPGEGVGKLSAPLDVRPFMANNGRQLTGDAADIRSLSMNHGLSQGVIDEPLLRSIYGKADPRLLAGIAGGTGLGLLAPLVGDTDQIRAPEHGWLANAVMAARDVEKRLEGHPASLLYPEGLVNWADRLSYGDRPTWGERIGAGLDFF